MNNTETIQIDKSKIWGFITIRDRLDATKECVRTVFESEPDINLVLFDNMSIEDWSERGDFYASLQELNQAIVILQPEKYLKDIKWHKGYNFHQFFSLIKNKDWEYAFCLDNDITVQGNLWLDDSIRLLNSKQAQEANIKIICLYDCPASRHSHEKYIDFESEQVSVRRFQGSGFWLATKEHWMSLKLPPYQEGIAQPDDIFMWNQMIPKQQKFASFMTPHAIVQNVASIKHKLFGNSF